MRDERLVRNMPAARARLAALLPSQKETYRPSVRGCASTLRRVYRWAKQKAWWPAATDLAKGRTIRNVAWIRRDLQTLEGAGLVVHAGPTWRLTQPGCDLLGVAMPAVYRSWRADEVALRKHRRALTELLLEDRGGVYE